MPRVNLWPWLRPFLILVLVVASPLLIYWFVYVQSSIQTAKQQAYVTLSAVATNLKDRLAAHQQIAVTAEKLQSDPQHLKAYLNSVLQPKRIVPVSANDKLHLEVGSVSGGLYLQVGTISRHSDVDCGSPSCSMRAVLPLENLIPWNVVQTEFDGLLVLSDTGELLAQDRRLPGQPLGVKVPLTGVPADLAKLLNRGNQEESGPASASQGAKENSSHPAQTLSPLDFSDGVSLQLAGTDYLAFLQPVWVVVTPVGQNDPADSATNTSTLKVMVCGLIQKERLRRQAIELAPQTLIAIGALVALGLFAIPFLKLRFIGARERMHPRDVWLLAISLLCATAVMVLIVMDAQAYDKLLERFDAGLKGFSTTVRSHVEAEASQATAQLAASAHLLLNTHVPLDGKPPAESNCEYRLAAGTSGNSPSASAPLGAILSIDEHFNYPDFEALVAMDLCGNQIRKIMPRTIATPYINVVFEPYFYPAVTLTPAAGAAFSYAAIVAPTSGLQLSVFAMPLDLNTGTFGAQLATTNRSGVIAAATQLRSVSAALIAQPFQFVLINRQGAVTYQQGQGPFAGERFFDAVLGGSTLEQSAQGGDSEPRSYRYRGQTYRMYAVDIPDLQLTLVAYYDRTIVGSLAARMFGTAALFALCIIVSMLIGGAIAVCWFGETALDWVWPSAERTPLYIFGCIACVASLAVLWAARNTLSSNLFMGFMLLAPLVSMIVLGSGYGIDALQRSLGGLWPHAGVAMLRSRRLTSLVFEAFAVMVMLAFVAWPTLIVFDDAYTLHATAFATGVARNWKIAKQQWTGNAAANVMNIETALPLLDCKNSADLRCNAPDRLYATRENYTALLDLRQRLGIYSDCVNLVNRKDPCHASAEPAVPSSSTLAVAYQLAGFGRGNTQLAQILSSFFTAQSHAPRVGLLEGYGWSRWVVGGFIFVVGALCLLIGSVAKHVLGIGMTDDGVLDEQNEFVPKDGTRWLLLRPTRGALLRMNDAITTHVDLRDAQPLPTRQPPAAGRVLCIHHLESRLADGKWRAGLLALLEAETAGCVVLTSEIDPLHYLTQRAREMQDELRTSGDEDQAMRAEAQAACRGLSDELSNWARALREIHKIREGLPSFEIPAGGCADLQLRAKIIAECNRTEPLIEIGTRLLSRGDLPAYRWDEIVGFVLDAAEPYYRSTWELCSREERLVLIQLAQEGLLNPKRLEIVRRLARRGLVSVDPRFRLMNESFRRFVRSVETPERIAEWERTTTGMSWSRLGTPLYAFAAVAIAILLYTQQAMFTSVLAIATGAAGTIGSLRSLYLSALKPAISPAKLA